ncbi:unnamed protein product, partial [Dovyalis caffra]
MVSSSFTVIACDLCWRLRSAAREVERGSPEPVGVMVRHALGLVGFVRVAVGEMSYREKGMQGSILMYHNMRQRVTLLLEIKRVTDTYKEANSNSTTSIRDKARTVGHKDELHLEVVRAILARSYALAFD